MQEIIAVNGVDLDCYGLIERDSLLEWQETCALLAHWED